LTHNTDLYTQHARHLPQLEAHSWLLYIDGTTERPLTLDYNTLLGMPAESRQSFHVCGAHTPTENRAQVAHWRGVPLSALLRRVQPTADTVWINIHSADGYATSIPIDLSSDALLATHLNGRQLPPEHGFPLRLVLPSHYGYKQPKWITHIVPGATPVSSPSEQIGWSPAGTQQPTVTVSKKRLSCSLGETIQLKGYTNGDSVDIALGGTWNPAAVNGFAWHTTWQPPTPGTHLLRARARTESAFTPVTLRPTIEITVYS